MTTRANTRYAKKQLEDYNPLLDNNLVVTFNNVYTGVQPSEDPMESESTTRFCERLYITRGQIPPSADTPLFLEFPELTQHSFGEFEQDILNFIFHSSDSLMTLIGPVGAGKTTLFHYTLGYLPNKCPTLGRSIIPVYINCFKKRAPLLSHQDPRVSVTDFLVTELNDELAAIMFEDSKPNNDEFWNTITRFKSFQNLRIAERNINDMDPGNAGDRLVARRAQEQEKPGFFIRAAGILNHKKRRLVLTLDNIDSLPLAAQNAAIDFALTFSETAKCKVLIPMRPETWKGLRVVYHDHGLPIGTELSPVDIKDVLTRRCELFLEEAQAQFKKTNDETQISYNRITRTISSSKYRVAYSQQQNIILGDDSIEFIKELSGGNLRDASRMAKRFFDSGRLSSVPAVTSELGVPALKIPSGMEHMEAMLCGGRKLFTTDDNNLFVNLFANDAESPPIATFIRISLLAYLQGIGSETTMGSLLETFASTSRHRPEMAKRQAKWALYRLLNAGLINSSSVYMFHNADEVEAHLAADVRITRAGAYYTERLLWNFTYISCIKDDAPVDSDYINEHRDLTRTPEIPDRFKATFTWLTHVANQELRFLSRFDDSTQATEILIHYNQVVRPSTLLSHKLHAQIYEIYRGSEFAAADHDHGVRDVFSRTQAHIIQAMTREESVIKGIRNRIQASRDSEPPTANGIQETTESTPSLGNRQTE